jgi:LPXTG-motif cell wall-anchored protein
MLLMKRLIFFYLLLINVAASAQNTPATNPKLPEPDLETSYDSEEILIIALVGLALLLALYFLFRRTRRH